MIRGIVELEAAEGAAVDCISCGRCTMAAVERLMKGGQEGLVVRYAARITRDEDDVVGLSFG